MKDLLLHGQTKSHLVALLNDPPHALLVIGQNGVGKLAVAKAWAAQLTSAVELIEPDDKGTISIDAIRELYRHTRSKREGRQVIIIDHAEAMGADAQNALLKLLEEPRSGVTFVLTAPTKDLLLATITSRTQAVHLNNLPATQLEAWAKELKPNAVAQELAQALFVANGRPAALKSLLLQEGDFERHKQTMQTAKQLLGATKYERVAKIGELSKDRTELVATLEAMSQMVKLQMQKGGEPKWLKLADGLQECLERLHQNANPRAQLLRLFMLY